LGEPVGKNIVGRIDQRHCWPDVFICRQLLAQPRMIMAFLLVVVVDNAPLNERFFFRMVDRCNFFAHMIESGQYKMVQNNRMSSQENVTAYCIPKYAPPNTKFWD
tara:strand:- start:474 stop:788 length:315 start_codon:yes stop_codon:yes gene_type:complete